MAFNPMLLAAMSDAPENESGLASGLVNTSFMMGGALGLAVLASIAAMKTKAVIVLGVEPINALVSGYHTAFIVGALFAALGATLAATILREPKASSSNQIHSGI
jgi:hypothetical protein